MNLKKFVALTSALALAGGVLQLGGSGSAEARAPGFSAAAEAKKMDAIPTPKLDWWSCYGAAQCATTLVPLDYDEPQGAKVELALVKVKARDPEKRVGTLFVNPGGPGGSATYFALDSSYIFSSDLLDRFDIVGMDPRGVENSQQVKCFPGLREQEAALQGYSGPFPVTSAEEKSWLATDKAEGQACTKSGGLALSMSTAEVARDMELMRRAVGDKKLTYLGFSYGSYLGQVSANMFPGRFRALAIDGVLDPLRWSGYGANAARPLGDNLRAADGAWKALREILVRCDRVGGAECSFAVGDPVANLDVIAQRLKQSPLEEEDPFTGDVFTYGYPELVADLFSLLYDPAGYEYIIELLTELQILTEPPADAKRSSAAATKRAGAVQKFSDLLRTTEDLRSERPRAGFPYYNGLDTFASVSCTDNAETVKTSEYPALAVKADQRAKYFGRFMTYNWSVCAADAYPGSDEDAFRGPFTTTTTSPVLVLGNYWDPITNYNGAVTADALLPNSRLLASDSWGHTAYGTSECVTSAVDSYLITGTPPKAGTVCTGDIQPFASDPEELAAAHAKHQAFRKAMGGQRQQR
ncbi:MAG: alpha/beta hydrolase [Propionibacteriaceae bacterium]